MKKASGLNRKQFIVLILSVCILALIAEGVLLVRTFASKSEKGKSSTTPAPTGEPPVSMMWVPVSHMCFREDGVFAYGESYEYDDQGRPVLMKMFRGEEGQYREVTYTYDKNGTKTEEWEVTEQETGKAALSVTGICGMTIRHEAGESYQCRYDNDGYIKEITKYDGTEGAEKPVETVKRHYKAGRLSGEEIYYADESGEWVLREEKEYRYEGDRTIVSNGSKETVYCGGRILESTTYAGRDRTLQVQKVTNHSVFPDRLDCLREVYVIGNWIKEYEPAETEAFGGSGTIMFPRSVEFNSEGLPVKVYSGDYRYDDDLEIWAIYQYDEKNRLIYIKGKERISGFMDRAPREMESLITYDDDDNPVQITYDNRIHRLEWNLIEVRQ